MNTQKIVGGKAINLLKLKKIRGINVPAFISISKDIDKTNARRTKIKNFLDSHKPTRVAVRSSSTNEDLSSASFAGMYETLLDIPAEVDLIDQAILRVSDVSSKQDVISHYAKKVGIESFEKCIPTIVQEMIIDPDLSGVIFSHDPHSKDFYYSISTTEGLGESIVGGEKEGNHFRVFRGINLSEIQLPWMLELIKSMRLIENAYFSNSLDVEFAFKNGILFILQCRPITLNKNGNYSSLGVESVATRINELQGLIDSSVKGDILGDMIDINPRELLGEIPSVLDVSIFRYLFSDDIVERVRKSIGYEPLNCGLLRTLGSKPYVSLKASAFSFRPRGISYEAYSKLVDRYIEILSNNPELQNSIEFDVFAMRSGDKLNSILDSITVLSEEEKSSILSAFSNLDSSIENISSKTFSDLEFRIAKYKDQIKKCSKSNLNQLLEIISVGTELFVLVARLAFYWKNRFEEKYTDSNLNQLLSGHLHSISSQMRYDLVCFSKGEIPRDEIILRYGHLRPGQFQVFGESYQDDPDYFLFRNAPIEAEDSKLNPLHDFVENYEFKNVVFFLKAREDVKFLFMKAFDNFTKKLQGLLADFGLSKEDASSMEWSALCAVLSGNNNYRPNSSEEKNVILPEIIIPGVTNLKIINYISSKPTYITEKMVRGDVVVLDDFNFQITGLDFNGKIVVIPTADPGFDFLFHSGIIGLITKSGGPASHMCIRSIELGVPSCVGCGEDLYVGLRNNPTAILDCLNKQIIF